MGFGLEPESIDALFRTGLIDAQSLDTEGPRSGPVASHSDNVGTEENVG